MTLCDQRLALCSSAAACSPASAQAWMICRAAGSSIAEAAELDRHCTAPAKAGAPGGPGASPDRPAPAAASMGKAAGHDGPYCTKCHYLNRLDPRNAKMTATVQPACHHA